jgi:APA family basic amino acid/polyamine antiporter
LLATLNLHLLLSTVHTLVSLEGRETMARSMDTSELFIRKASGLVRVAGGFDTFIYCIGLISVGAGIFTGFYFRTFYPGSNFLLATLITGVGSLFVALCFYMFSVVFPRSGGTFVFLSRTAGPGLAFSVTFFEAVAFSFLGAVNAYFIVQVGLAPLFSTFGFLLNSDAMNDVATWLATETGTFIIGAVVLVGTGLIPVLGMRKLLLFNRVMFGLAVLGVVLGVLVLLFSSPETFSREFQAETGLGKAEVINAARESGYTAGADFSWGETIKLTVWPAGYLAFAVMSAGIGGEIKRVRQSQFVGMVGSVVVATLLIALYIPLADGVFGRTFMDALVWNSTSAPDFSTAAPPYVTLLLGILSPNILVGGLIIVGFIAWLYFLVSPQLVYAQRLLVAWSFDRLAPERLGYVSERYNSPTVAIVLTVLVAFIFLVFIAYGVLPLLAYILGIFAVWALIGIMGALFPWTRPELFRGSPIARYTIGGIPAITVVSVPAAAFLMWQLYLYWQDPLVAGHTTPTLVGHAIGIGLGIVSYVIVRNVREKQGVQLDKIFTELPIE